jgi:hypothetical protein
MLVTSPPLPHQAEPVQAGPVLDAGQLLLCALLEPALVEVQHRLARQAGPHCQHCPDHIMKVIDGKYRILELIDEGQFGKVFRAEY